VHLSRPLLIAIGALAILGPSTAIYTFFGQRFLTAGCKIAPGGIGIPGITKTYGVALVNTGLLPVRIAACDITTDAGEQGIELATSIDKWDRNSQRWATF
jgi:hypothetical protein